jgi:hypothetical protein
VSLLIGPLYASKAAPPEAFPGSVPPPLLPNAATPAPPLVPGPNDGVAEQVDAGSHRQSVVGWVRGGGHSEPGRLDVNANTGTSQEVSYPRLS